MTRGTEKEHLAGNNEIVTDLIQFAFIGERTLVLQFRIRMKSNGFIRGQVLSSARGSLE